MAKTRDIQRRIKSIASTKKITRAMEMVAAAKMRKAVEAALATRTYANLSWETLMNVSRSGGASISHPLLEVRTEVKRQALVLITSNRGLCGGFNTALIAEVRRMTKGLEAATDLILLGRKGESLASTLTVTGSFPKSDGMVDSTTIQPIARLVIDGYANKTYDRVLVAYTDFINAVKQSPRVRQLLPIVTEASDGSLGLLDKDDRVGLSQEFIATKGRQHASNEYVFEPNPQEVLNSLVPRLVEVQLFQAVLESTASEHSARMAAMHQATKAASDLVEELTLFYNKARQASITAEIAEITAGVAALE